MDPVQTVIIFISLVITTLIVVLGVQIYFILKEVKISVAKLNKMLDDGGKMTGAMSDTVVGMSGLLEGVRAGLSVFRFFRKKEG